MPTKDIPPFAVRVIQTTLMIVGSCLVMASCYMTWKFGSSISNVHGIGLIGCTVFAALVFPAREMLARMGASKQAQRNLLAVGIFAIGLEFVGDLGYTFGMRDKQLVESGAQQTTYKAAQKSVIEDETNLAKETDRLEKMKLAFPWAVSVSADGERSKLVTLQKAVDLEAAKGGCKGRCLQKMEEKRVVEERIANIEEINAAAKKIADLQTRVDSKRKEAASTGVGHSTVAAQTTALAKAFKLISTAGSADALNPDAVELTIADMIIGLMMAVGACILPTYCFQIAFFGPKQEEKDYGYASHPAMTRPTLNKYAVANRPGANITNYIVEQPQQAVVDPSGTRALDELQRLRNNLRAISQPRTA